MLVVTAGSRSGGALEVSAMSFGGDIQLSPIAVLSGWGDFLAEDEV